MEITRLTVAGVGRFSDEVTVDGFGAGVNVLAAPNESGKSTLFRALRACLFERHNAKSAPVLALETDGASLPIRIAVEFTHDGRSYRIAKSFRRSTSASFSVDGREIARDRAADEMVWDLLGIEPGGRSVDQAAFGMLWVGQRDSFALPALTKAGENQVGAAIEAEVGAIAGSERAKAILADTRAELARYVTEKAGKATAQGPLGLAMAERDKCRNALDQCRERLRVLEDQFARLEMLLGERATVTDPAAAAQIERDLTEARRDLQAATEAADKLAALEAEAAVC